MKGYNKKYLFHGNEFKLAGPLWVQCSVSWLNRQAPGTARWRGPGHLPMPCVLSFVLIPFLWLIAMLSSTWILPLFLAILQRAWLDYTLAFNLRVFFFWITFHLLIGDHPSSVLYPENQPSSPESLSWSVFLRV